MTDTNKVILIGRLTRDISEQDLGYINTGTPKLNFSIAVNRSVKRGEEWADDVSFFDITYWGKPAEAIKKYIGKGKQVAVTGFLKQDRWNDNNGNSRSKVVVIAESVQLLGGKSENDSNSGYSNRNNQNQKSTFTPKQSYDHGTAIQEEFPEDIPF